MSATRRPTGMDGLSGPGGGGRAARGGPAGQLTGRWAARDLGSLPVVVALVVLWLVFQAANPSFLSADNLVNLTMQVAPLGVLTLGVVLVLMVGQIDLSTGAVSGLAAALVAVAGVQEGWPLWLSVIAAVLVGAGIGAAYGWAFTRLGLPSFVLTLAGLLVSLGVQLRILGATGSVNIPYESWLVVFTQQTFLAPWFSSLLALTLVVGWAGARLVERRRRLAAELPAEQPRQVALRAAGLAAATLLPVWYLSTNRGVGAPFALFLALVLVTDVALRRTRWGRSVRAVGSDVGSAHRAGFGVRRVYLSAFVACSALAALGGVLSAGRLAAANQGSGGSDTNLTVIAAAVIGGTSLFGGRGSAWSAVLGVLVIGSISSGLTLLSLDSAPRYVVTGLVLALAVTLDALGRRRRPVAGR